MRTVTLFVLLSCITLPARSATLTFEDALARAIAARAPHTVPQDALSLLENPGKDWPSIRAEGTFSNARNIDLFRENLVHSQFLSALVSVDYPLLDGGASRIRGEAARLEAEAFRQRVRELEDDVYAETVDAVARLYLAQERKAILEKGFERAVSLGARAEELLRVNEISNLTAAQWQDTAAAAELELLDLERERLDAENHLKMLIGETSPDPLEVTLALDEPPAHEQPPAGDPRASILTRQRQLSLDEARAARRPQILLSGFGGVATISSDEHFSLFGLRMTLSLPMLDAAATRREAAAKLQAAEADMERTAAAERLRRSRAQEMLNADVVARRIEILMHALDVARRRADSVARLTAAGLRSESALADAGVDVARRESDLLTARVERWRLSRSR